MLGKIINKKLTLHPSYIINTHTSCINKKYKEGIKKKMNDEILHHYNTNSFKGTLIPTNSHYACSFAHFNKNVCDHQMTNIKFHNQPGDVRRGDQVEMKKSDHIIGN